MREYGQVQSSFWQSSDAQGWTDEAKLFAVYLLTSPHANGIGAYRLPDGYIAADIGWDSQRVHRAFDELERCRFAYRFGDLVAIRSFLKWNPVANPNAGKARAREFNALPNGDCKAFAAAEILEHGKYLPDGFGKVLEPIAKGCRKHSGTLVGRPSETVLAGVRNNRPDQTIKSKSPPAARGGDQ